MRTTHRVTSAFKQKTARDCAAIYGLIAKLQPFTPEELRRLSLPIRVSFESLKKGAGTYSDYQDLADAINVSMVRAEEIDPLAEAMVLRARDAMVRVVQRFECTGVWVFDGPAIGEVAEALDFYDQLLEMSSPQQMHDALMEVKKRCEWIRAEKAKAQA